MQHYNDASYASTEMDETHDQSHQEESVRSRPPISAPPLPLDGPHARDAKKVLALEASLKEQMDFYGSGHPHSGQLAVSFATMCNEVARGCLQEGRLRLAHQLLERALHLLRLDHSALLYGENQRAMAAACCNMGSLMHRRHLPQEALKWIMRAIHIESKADYEPSHATTLINASATYSLLGRHDEALTAAQRAVDLLCAQPGWHLCVEKEGDEAGEVLPMAFNNLAVEFEHVGDGEMARQSYAYAADLARKRWGEDDVRTRGILEHQEEAEKGKELEHFDAEAAQIFYGRRKGKPARKQAVQVMSVYDESTSPVERRKEKAPGWHSPRFWSSSDGMNPRRISPYTKDLAQIGLEMARTASPALFPSHTTQSEWGESRLVWRDLPDADLSRIDGSVPSRSRLFSDVASNSQLNALHALHKRRNELSSRYPRNFAVFKVAKELADKVAAARKPAALDMSTAFLSGTYLARPFRIH